MSMLCTQLLQKVQNIENFFEKVAFKINCLTKIEFIASIFRRTFKAELNLSSGFDLSFSSERLDENRNAIRIKLLPTYDVREKISEGEGDISEAFWKLYFQPYDFLLQKMQNVKKFLKEVAFSVNHLNKIELITSIFHRTFKAELILSPGVTLNLSPEPRDKTRNAIRIKLLTTYEIGQIFEVFKTRCKLCFQPCSFFYTYQQVL